MRSQPASFTRRKEKKYRPMLIYFFSEIRGELDLNINRKENVQSLDLTTMNKVTRNSSAQQRSFLPHAHTPSPSPFDNQQENKRNNNNNKIARTIEPSSEEEQVLSIFSTSSTERRTSFSHHYHLDAQIRISVVLTTGHNHLIERETIGFSSFSEKKQQNNHFRSFIATYATTLVAKRLLWVSFLFTYIGPLMFNFSFQSSGKKIRSIRYSDAHLGSRMTPLRRSFSHTAVWSSLVVLLLVLLGDAVSVQGGETVSVLDLSQIASSATDETYDKMNMLCYYQGVQAYLKSISNKAGTTTINLIDSTTYGKTTDITGTITDALTATPGIIACIGPYGDENVGKALVALEGKNIVLFGPFVGGIAQNVWNNQLFFTKMSSDGELIMLLKMAVVNSVARRIGFFYTTGVECGELLFAKAKEYLQAINGGAKLVAYAPQHTAAFDSSTFNTFADNAPGVTLIQGKTGDHMEQFLKTYMTDTRTKGLPLLGSTFQQILIVQELTANVATTPVYIASALPPMSASTMSSVAEFTTQMSAYLGNSDATTHPEKGNVMFLGYATMTALAYTFTPLSDTVTTTAASFQTSLYSDYSRLFFKDYVLGFYGGDFNDVMRIQGVIYQCNQGGQSVYVSSYDSSGAATEVQPNHTNAVPTCGIHGTLPFATSAAFLNYDSSSILSANVYSKIPPTAISDPIPALSEGPYLNERLVILNMDPATDWATRSQIEEINAIIGPVDLDVTTVDDTIILWSPIYGKPQINMYSNNEYYITPTFAQDMITFYAYLASPPASPVVPSNTITGMVKGAPSVEQTYYMEEGMVALAELFKLTSVFIEPMDDTTTFDKVLWNQGYNIIIGALSSDIDAIAKFLTDNNESAAFIPYRTLSLIFDTAKTGFASVQGRILTDSNIEYWTSSSKHPITQELNVATEMLRRTLSRFVGESQALPYGPMTAEGVTIGPFYPKNTPRQVDAKESARGRNWGAQTNHIVGMETAAGGAGSPLFSMDPDSAIYTSIPYVKPTTTTTTSTTTKKPTSSSSSSTKKPDKPSPSSTSSSSSTTTKKPPTSSAPTTSKPTTKKPEPPSTPDSPPHSKRPINKQKMMLWILYVLCLLVLAAIVITIICLMCAVCCVARNAPTNTKKAVTMVFMDIDYGVALQTELPELHSEAAEKVEEIVRDIIRVHKAYEVHCDGNSQFTIACKEPLQGVQIATEIQSRMFANEWGTTKFDEWYRLMEEKLQTRDSPFNPTLNEETYRMTWNGLRVRCGVHTGLCGIHYQSSAKKYRYYGQTVQTARYLEELAHGGQSLVSESTWHLLSPSEITSIDYTYLGLHPIRGEDHPEAIYSLCSPEELHMKENGKDRDETDSISSEAEAHAAALRRCFSSFPPDQLVGELQPIAEAWGVNLIRANDATDEEYSQYLLRHIAARMVNSDSLGGGQSSIFNGPLRGAESDALDNSTIDVEVHVDMDTDDTFSSQPQRNNWAGGMANNSDSVFSSRGTLQPGEGDVESFDTSTVMIPFEEITLHTSIKRRESTMMSFMLRAVAPTLCNETSTSIVIILLCYFHDRYAFTLFHMPNQQIISLCHIHIQITKIHMVRLGAHSYVSGEQCVVAKEPLRRSRQFDRPGQMFLAYERLFYKEGDERNKERKSMNQTGRVLIRALYLRTLGRLQSRREKEAVSDHISSPLCDTQHRTLIHPYFYPFTSHPPGTLRHFYSFYWILLHNSLHPPPKKNVDNSLFIRNLPQCFKFYLRLSAPAPGVSCKLAKLLSLRQFRRISGNDDVPQTRMTLDRNSEVEKTEMKSNYFLFWLFGELLMFIYILGGESLGGKDSTRRAPEKRKPIKKESSLYIYIYIDEMEIFYYYYFNCYCISALERTNDIQVNFFYFLFSALRGTTPSSNKNNNNNNNQNTFLSPFFLAAGGSFSFLDLSQIATSAADETYDKMSMLWYHQGLMAFAKSVQNKYGEDDFILIDGTKYGKPTDIAGTIADALKESRVLACVGVYGEENVAKALAALAGEEHGAVRPGCGWNEVQRVEQRDNSELLVILQQAVGRSLPRQIGFFYTDGVDCGPGLLQKAREYLNEVGMESMLLPFVAPHHSDLDKSQFDTFASASPGCIVVLGKPGAVMQSFLNAVMTDARTQSALLIGGTMQQMMIMEAQTANKATTKNVVVIVTGFPTTISTFDAITVFHANAKALLGNDDAQTYPWKGSMMFLGYSTLAAVYNSLSVTIPGGDAAGYQANLFSQFSRFLLINYVMGYVGGDCTGMACGQGAIQHCNHMGQNVYSLEVQPEGTVSGQPVTTNFFPSCALLGKMPFGTRVAFLDYSSSAMLKAAYEKIGSIADDPIPEVATGSPRNHRFLTNKLVAGDWASFSKQYLVQAVVGPMDDSVTKLDDQTILWDPIYDKPQVNMFRTNEYHITPTFAQDIIMLYAYLQTGPSSPVASTAVTGMVKGALNAVEEYNIQEGVVTLGTVFSIAPVFIERLDAGETVETKMWSEGYNIIIGAVAADVAPMAKFLEANTEAAAFLPYRTLSLIFDDAKTGLSGVQGRILTDSNIEYWSTTSKHPITEETGCAAELLQKDPYGFRPGSISPRFALPLRPWRAMTCGKVTVGPFYAAGREDQVTGVQHAYPRNWGATETYLVTGTTAFTGSGSPLHTLAPNPELFTPGPTPILPTTTAGPGGEITGATRQKSHVLLGVLIALCVLAAAAVVVMVCYLCCGGMLASLCSWCLCCCALPGGDAPTDPQHSVTIIFIDVDYNAALWDSFPEAYAKVLSDVRGLVRHLVAIHHCYEVDSDGSRFMIVSKTPFNAVMLAADVQVALLEHDWELPNMNQWYKEMERRGSINCCSQLMGGGGGSGDVVPWNGPRVRVGVHSGPCGIALNWRAKKRQYFGPAVRTALKVEEMGVGGQSLVTENTWEMLTPEQMNEVEHVFLGPHAVIDEEYPLGLYLLKAVPGRSLVPLRAAPMPFATELSTGTESGGSETEIGRTTGRTPRTEISAQSFPLGSVLRLLESLQRCFDPVPPKERVGEVIPIAERWGVAVPVKEAWKADEAYCDDVLYLVAHHMLHPPRPGQRHSVFVVSQRSYLGGRREDFGNDSSAAVVQVIRNRKSSRLASSTRRQTELLLSHRRSRQEESMEPLTEGDAGSTAGVPFTRVSAVQGMDSDAVLPFSARTPTDDGEKDAREETTTLRRSPVIPNVFSFPGSLVPFLSRSISDERTNTTSSPSFKNAYYEYRSYPPSPSSPLPPWRSFTSARYQKIRAYTRAVVTGLFSFISPQKALTRIAGTCDVIKARKRILKIATTTTMNNNNNNSNEQTFVESQYQQGNALPKRNDNDFLFLFYYYIKDIT
eukprot:gene8070-5622_t